MKSLYITILLGVLILLIILYWLIVQGKHDNPLVQFFNNLPGWVFVMMSLIFLIIIIILAQKDHLHRHQHEHEKIIKLKK